MRLGGWWLSLMLVAGCASDQAGPGPVPEAEFITERRAWLPGERDSLIAFIKNTQMLDIPGAGNVSDDADGFFPVDSKTVIIPNPAYAGAPGGWLGGLSAAHGLGPRGASAAALTMIPGAGFTTVAIDIRTIDNSQAPPDTVDALGAFWFNDADSTRVGFVFAATAATSVTNRTVSTVPYDASFRKTGAGGGEIVHIPSTTYWEARGGGGGNNRMSVAAPGFCLGATTMTSGPYTGGTRRYCLSGAVNLDGIRLTRITGTGTPQFPVISFSAAANNLIRVEYVCIFPTPCTSAAAIESARALRAGQTAR